MRAQHSLIAMIRSATTTTFADGQVSEENRIGFPAALIGELCGAASSSQFLSRSFYEWVASKAKPAA
jgi:hypothetical protein